MASIERRARDGKVRWRAHYRTPDGRQRNRTFDRKIDAERFLTTVEASKLTGSFVDPTQSRVTVAAMTERWWASKVRLSAKTRNKYESAMNTHVEPRWGATPLAQITHEAVQEWVTGLAGRYSGAHVHTIHGVLAAVLDYAVRTSRLPANPARGVELPAAKSKPKKYLTAGQVEVMADAAGVLPADVPRRRTDGDRAQYRLAVLVLAYCGLRWSELAALTVGSMDGPRRRLSVSQAVVELDDGTLVWKEPKSFERRWVPVEPDLAADLEAHVASRASDELLFTAPGGAVMRNGNARRGWFDRAAADAGAPGLTPHELRHTAASLAVSAGANVKAVQRMLGHASATITLDLYTDLFDDDLEAVGTRLGEVRAKAGVARALPGQSSSDTAAAG